MAQAVPELGSLEHPVFRAYLFYSSILVLKMMAMSLLTARARIKNKAFASPEDSPDKKAKLVVNEDVERCRRAHFNDLENIPIFFVAAYIYTLTNPSEYVAKTLFLAFTAARILHTFVYAVVVIPQPARGASWAVGYLIVGFMAAKSLLYFL